MAWWLRSLVGTGLLLCVSACSSSSGDNGGTGGAGSSGGAGGSGGAPAITNVYISEFRNAAGAANCLPRPITVGAQGEIGNATTGCYLVEARATAPSCGCDTAMGRVALSAAQASIPPNAVTFLRNSSECDQAGLPACADYCFCELVEFSGAEQKVCETQVTDPGTQYGFCYLDGAYDGDGDGKPDVNPELLASCDVSEKRMLRFMGSDIPASDARSFIACMSPLSPAP